MDIRKFFGGKPGPAKGSSGDKKTEDTKTDDTTKGATSSKQPQKSPPKEKAVKPPAGKRQTAPISTAGARSPVGKRQKKGEEVDLTSEDEFQSPVKEAPTKPSPKDETKSSFFNSKVESAKKEEEPSAPMSATPKKRKPPASFATPLTPSTEPSIATQDPSPAKRKRASPASKKEIPTSPCRDWMPPLQEETDLKFSLGEETGGWQANGPAGGDPPNRGNKPTPRGRDGCLEGLTFVISGTLDSLTREEAADLVKRHGGRVTGSVSGKTDYLLVGMQCGRSKYDKAKVANKEAKAKEAKAKEAKVKDVKEAKEVKLVDEDGLFAIIRASGSSEPDADEVQAPDVKPDVKPKVQKPEVKQLEVKPTVSRSPSRAPTVPWSAVADARSKPAAAALPAIVGDTSLWVTKHRPKHPRDLIGNSDKIRQLQQWLESWHATHLGKATDGKGKGRAGAARDLPKKAVLLSGPPGIGKTSSAGIIAKALGYMVTEVNASDTRGKSDRDVDSGVDGKLANAIKEMVTNRSVSIAGGCTAPQKKLLIMDEVDGMSGNGERGGMADLIETIKISKIPIICICNDQYNTKVKALINHCLDLKFSKPMKKQVAKRMIVVASSEGLTVDEATMESLVESCNNDIRWVLNTLQMRRKASTRLCYDDVAKQGAGGSAKDVDLSPFNVTDLLLGPFCSQRSITERINLMFQDADLMPLFIQENYINMRPTAAGNDEALRMDLLASAADCISASDIANTKVRAQGKWGLMPFTNFCSVNAASLMTGRREIFGLFPGERNFSRFPAWLGKNSSTSKGKRLLGDLHAHASGASHFTADRQALRQTYLPLLRQMITTPLVSKDKDGIDEVMATMNAYGFSREDWDSVQELTKFKGKAAAFKDPAAAIATATKSAFTKECNKDTRPVRDASMQIKGMKKSKGRKKSDNDDMEEEDEAAGLDEEKDEEVEKAEAKKLSKISNAKMKRMNFEGQDGAKAPSGSGKGTKAKAGGGRAAAGAKPKPKPKPKGAGKK